jgi:hypothetical protein
VQQSDRAAIHGDGQGSGVGVYGHAERVAGVYGHSDDGNGVEGSTRSSDINGAAIVGTCRRPDYSVNFNGYAGVFNGRVYVGGALEKAGGGFKIDHPLDPANTCGRSGSLRAYEFEIERDSDATCDLVLHSE